MALSLQDIIPQINAEIHGAISNTEIDNVSIDSRSLQNNQNTLFFALSGPNYDAHFYIQELIDKGVENFVVTHIPENTVGKASFFVVEDTKKALQQFAEYYRTLFHFPVIGITGSNGKTIVKEWLNFLLSPDYNIIRSPKSYNSQVGVPLSVLAINEMHNLGIFEAGISTVNEMSALQKIIKPTIGLLTNIGSAHDEGFDNIGEKIKEKLQLFRDVDVLIYHKNKAIEQFLPSVGFQNSAEKKRTFNWSFKDKDADVFIRKSVFLDKTLLKVTINEQSFEVKVPFLDDASVENAVQCLVVLLHFGYNFKTIENRIDLLYPVEMRLKVKNGINNTTIIDDSYSSDFQSLKIALDFLEHQKQHKKKIGRAHV